jgi:hypothetical protein
MCRGFAVINLEKIPDFKIYRFCDLFLGWQYLYFLIAKSLYL